MTRLLAALLLVLVARSAWAFDLAALSQQLNASAVVRGQFTQEKYLRALPQPLVSTGHFVLARGHGLLWQLENPFERDYRIRADGIAQRTAQGWQPVSAQTGGSRQNALFLAVLSGDTEALAHDFALQLDGDAAAWKLTLTPRSALLAQIFRDIHIQGGATVERIELNEAQGDRSVLRLVTSETDERLDEGERHAFGD